MPFLLSQTQSSLSYQGLWGLACITIQPLKPISANPRLSCPNPRDKFILRLHCVPRSAINTNQGINWGLNLIHLARWINSLIGGKSSKTKQNGGLVVWRFCFNAVLRWKKSNSGYLMTFPKHILLFSRVCAIPRPVFPRFFTTRMDRCREITRTIYWH